MESIESQQAKVTAAGEYIAKIGGRKFTLVVLVFLVSAVLCWFGKIDQTIFSAITVTLITGFITGNVLQKKIT